MLLEVQIKSLFESILKAHPFDNSINLKQEKIDVTLGKKLITPEEESASYLRHCKKEEEELDIQLQKAIVNEEPNKILELKELYKTKLGIDISDIVERYNAMAGWDEKGCFESDNKYESS